MGDQGPLDPSAARAPPSPPQVPRGWEDRQPHLPQLLREVEGQPVQEQEGLDRTASQGQGREGQDQAARGAVGPEEGEGPHPEGEEGRQEGGGGGAQGGLSWASPIITICCRLLMCHELRDKKK